jgi:hypothetical protein
MDEYRNRHHANAFEYTNVTTNNTWDLIARLKSNGNTSDGTSSSANAAKKKVKRTT